MKIIFVADAHLRGIDDPNQENLTEFLSWLTAEDRRPDKLVLLGDLFDFWTGNCRVVFDHYRPVLDALLKLKEAGVKIIYLEGNHDFSMGPFFTKDLAAEVFTSSHEIDIEGQRTFLAHGDICDDSSGYRIWRWLIRSFFFRALIYILPDKMIWNIAKKLSGNSRRNPIRSRELERRFKNFARKKIALGFDNVILAHTHIPAVKAEVANKKKGTYANPGSFEGSKKYLQYSDGKFRVRTFSKPR
ncbi:hypothetical protein MNBD_DELTA02-134 [hydrothermal vent metagenome]|uniref:Calcineurin-like phosphoesterase domain-containing protein n=1 Tax=hydrothermal vent metagenome TaxID=652676 RepID=A0A3B0UVS5_9ZZZZ